MNNNHNAGLLDHLAELNLTYLLTAQQMIRANRSEALIRLCLDDKTADAIAEMTAKDMTSLARSHQMLIAPRSDAAARIRDTRDKKRDPAHWDLLVASNFAVNQ